MPRGKMTSGREKRQTATRANKRPAAGSDADYVAPSNKRRKAEDQTIVVQVPIDDDENDPDWKAGSESSTPRPTTKPKASVRGRNKGKAKFVGDPLPITQQTPTSCQIGAFGGSMQWRDGKKRPPHIPGSFRWVRDSTGDSNKPKKAEMDDEGSKKSRKTGDEPRKILAWARPRMYEKLLLNLVYECGKANIELPWDRIAHRLEPGTSKDAILQAIERLRQSCLAEGNLIPPEIGTKDPWTRGFTRVYPDSVDEIDILHCRSVGWYEEVDHPKEKNPTGERLTFNGAHKFRVTYADSKAPVPDEWKEDLNKRKNEIRLTGADLIRMAKEEEEEQYDGDSSSSPARPRFAGQISSSSAAEHKMSEDFAGNEEDSAGDDHDMEYDHNEDGDFDDETREITPTLENTRIDSRPNGRRMPRTNKASTQQTNDTNRNGITTRGYQRNTRANTAVRNSVHPNGLPHMDDMSALNSPFTPQPIAANPQPNVTHGLAATKQ
ncbi:hypothetical protein PG996_004191 [Apiospora saccharicola]|uniref:Uncharacterized protein n=1 Tax=Apiospora saccharicola TaxID=335842 RepID=A0ABR1W657_9PEZI